jgi:hypothetical protein
LLGRRRTSGDCACAPQSASTTHAHAPLMNSCPSIRLPRMPLPARSSHCKTSLMLIEEGHARRGQIRESNKIGCRPSQATANLHRLGHVVLVRKGLLEVPDELLVAPKPSIYRQGLFHRDLRGMRERREGPRPAELDGSRRRRRGGSGGSSERRWALHRDRERRKRPGRRQQSNYLAN